MEPVSGPHGLDRHVRERTRPKPFRLDVLAERSEVAIHLSQLGAAIASVRLQRRHRCDGRRRRGRRRGEGRHEGGGTAAGATTETMVMRAGFHRRLMRSHPWFLLKWCERERWIYERGINRCLREEASACTVWFLFVSINGEEEN